MNLGVITYDCFHLKTWQLIESYLVNRKVTSIKIFELPFTPRKNRSVIFQHRPNMLESARPQSPHTKSVEIFPWDGKEKIGASSELFVIGGAGILDVSFAEGTPIVNCHPGIIPTARGLDAFKWSILNGDPIGNTLHFIDKEVDKGVILKIQKTPVLEGDSISTLAQRHYDSEIALLSNVLEHLNCRESGFHPERPATMRMKADTERQMLDSFDDWKQKMLRPKS